MMVCPWQTTAWRMDWWDFSGQVNPEDGGCVTGCHWPPPNAWN